MAQRFPLTEEAVPFKHSVQDGIKVLDSQDLDVLVSKRNMINSYSHGRLWAGHRQQVSRIKSTHTKRKGNEMEKNPIHIRDASTHERDIMRQITLAAYEEYEAVLPPSFWTQYRQHLLETLDEGGSVERIVAEQDGVIGGSVLLYPEALTAYRGIQLRLHVPEVRFLAVLPSMRGQGIGKALMDECMRRAQRIGAKALGLHTMEIMGVAVHMYEHMGFVRAPELDFSPVEGMLVIGYRHALDGVSQQR